MANGATQQNPAINPNQAVQPGMQPSTGQIQGQMPRKKSSWLKWLLIIALLVFVLGIGIYIFFALR